jgi:HlyD family secretion protein
MMTSIWIKRSLGIAALAAAIGALVYALLPQPVAVDSAVIARGAMRVTVDEEGKTRIREIYRISAPIAGKVQRSPRKVGDDVIAGETLVAVIRPNDPPFLDRRTRQELEAAVSAARAAIAHAETEVRKARTELKFAESDFERSKSLSRTNVISERAMERSALDVDVRKDALAAADANLDLRRRELDSARARLIGPEDTGVYAIDPPSCCVEVHAPVSGRVLKIVTESEQVVQAGALLLEVGDPKDLEIVVELLSSDAVKVTAGNDATIDDWGNERSLKARVRRVEPSGFTKVSALGIEEQRVNVVLDIVEPPEAWTELGHDFRVFARIAVWQSEEVLRVPLGALFRSGSAWSVFRIEDGRARLVPVEIGQRNAEMAEVTGGLGEGDRVVLHPSDRVGDGVAVEERE